MLLVAGQLGNVSADVINQFAGADEAVVVVVGEALAGLSPANT